MRKYLEDDVSRQQVHLYDSGQQRMDEALLRLAEQRALADEPNQACQSNVALWHRANNIARMADTYHRLCARRGLCTDRLAALEIEIIRDIVVDGCQLHVRVLQVQVLEQSL